MNIILKCSYKRLKRLNSFNSIKHMLCFISLGGRQVLSITSGFSFVLYKQAYSFNNVLCLLLKIMRCRMFINITETLSCKR
jgi:hypothetical protein